MKFLNSKPVLIILSVLLAFVLYFNANTNTVQNQVSANNGQPYTATIKDTPIDIKYDSDKYFISGYNSVANVLLSSYNQILINQEENASLRNMTLSADLSRLGVGVHSVPIKISGISQDLNAQVSPSSLRVTIEEKASKTMDIVPQIDTGLLPSGISVESVSFDTDQVIVTAGKSSIKNIAQIEAILPSNVDLHKDYTGRANLAAVDTNGNIVLGLLSQNSVKMTVKVKSSATSSSSAQPSSSSGTQPNHS